MSTAVGEKTLWHSHSFPICPPETAWEWKCVGYIFFWNLDLNEALLVNPSSDPKTWDSHSADFCNKISGLEKLQAFSAVNVWVAFICHLQKIHPISGEWHKMMTGGILMTVLEGAANALKSLTDAWYKVLNNLLRLASTITWYPQLMLEWSFWNVQTYSVQKRQAATGRHWWVLANHQQHVKTLSLGQKGSMPAEKDANTLNMSGFIWHKAHLGFKKNHVGADFRYSFLSTPQEFQEFSKSSIWIAVPKRILSKHV